MKSKAIVLFGVGAILASLAPAYADDWNPPNWRGNSGTSWVQYEFLTDDPTPDPDGGFLPFGTPSITVTPGPGAGWFERVPGYMPNSSPTNPSGYGWWNLSGEIDLWMPNSPILNPHKEIWIQLTWSPQALGNLPVFTVESPFGTTPATTTPLVHTVLYEEFPGQDFGVKVAHKRMRLPGIMSQVAWLVDKLLQGLGLYHQKIHVLSEMNKTIACSVKKAEEELGYDPKVDLPEGMRRSIHWMIENGQKL